MLGVMTVRKEELKIREFDRYRAFYCGLIPYFIFIALFSAVALSAAWHSVLK